ncbi:MAG: protein kinase [Polyangia bacterium]
MTEQGLDTQVQETTIFILADDPVSTRLLRQILMHRGYRTQEVRSPAALRAAIAKQRPHLIMLDVVTPGADVYELCRQLSSSPDTYRIPVLFLSAFQQAADKARAFQEGGADYLTKPFQPAEVLARISHQLKLARLQRELEHEKAELESSYARLRQAHRRLSLMTGVVSEHLAGEQLDGKYLLEEKIDSGGFGVVYRARHLSLQRPVAVKILRLSRPDDAEQQLERFRREGALACRVNHPNAISVLDSGVSPEGIPYLVMELLTGHSLQERLVRQGGRLSVAECLRIIEPVCEVLVDAHAAGVIHRDIKPENIFLHQASSGEVVKVLDFGIAELRGLDQPSLTRLTHPDLVIGTALYIAPERLRGVPYDGRSDVYSVAVMLYEMLHGHPPCAGYVDSPELEIPPALARAVCSGLACNPEQRPIARELLLRLQAVRSELRPEPAGA